MTMVGHGVNQGRLNARRAAEMEQMTGVDRPPPGGAEGILTRIARPAGGKIDQISPGRTVVIDRRPSYKGLR
jgi:hypothetical protein